MLLIINLINSFYYILFLALPLPLLYCCQINFSFGQHACLSFWWGRQQLFYLLEYEVAKVHPSSYVTLVTPD